jgi:putative ABC transport system permease protein
MKAHNPPRFAQTFLRWYCKPSLLEDLEGDLNEFFERNIKDKGVTRAKLIYIIDVVKFLRLYTIRKPESINDLIQWVMLASYIKTSGRNILRNKFFSSINIIGLAVSMTVGLLMIGMLYDSLSYDRFHDNHERIYRVISQYQYRGQQDDDFYATTSLRAAKLIKDEVTGSEDVVIIRRYFRVDVKAGEKTLPVEHVQANESLFKVFTFPLISGNPATALKEPLSAIITETTARRLFASTDVLGKTITINKDHHYTITGVMKDIPKFSHMNFDVIGSLSTLDVTNKDDQNLMKWDRMWDTYAYVLLPPNADLGVYKSKLDKLSLREDKTVKDTHIELALQPLTDIVTGENLSNQFGPTIGDTTIKVFGALTFIVILSACFNYTNLSIARSFRRFREVGIRKTIGAFRSHVMFQFIVESVIISVVSLIFAFGLFLLVKPHFISLEPSLQQLLVLDLSPSIVVLFILFALFVGISAGLFPALFFSKLNAVQVLKNISNKNFLKGIGTRKALIVFQYTLSIILITGTMVIHQQYKHFMAFDLGFTTDNILNVRLYQNNAEILKNELSTMPEVKGISESSTVMGIGHYNGTFVKNPNDAQDSSWIYMNKIDDKFLEVHDLKLIAGRNFTPLPDSAEESEVIVNEHLLKRFKVYPDNPAKAIDEMIKVDGKNLRIVGVVEQFQYGRANDRAGQEVMLRYANSQDGYVNLKINSSDWPATYEKLASVWKKIDSVHPFEAKFYKEQLEEAFKGLNASAKLGGFIAFLVISISSIGLLGMVVYTTETRLREISVRKVFGAREVGLLYLLGKGFILLLGIAACIGVPVTYLFFDQVLLPQIANHAPMSFIQLLTGVAVIMALALLMIGTQTLKVARTNPADVLKSE